MAMHRGGDLAGAVTVPAGRDDPGSQDPVGRGVAGTRQLTDLLLLDQVLRRPCRQNDRHDVPLVKAR
ncbi:hypothetical protein BL254_21380 [Protofrankia sp. BMG5.30]|nr:hypothetical protein BL254_21380 [Protofrankia sp. BMG5.30]